MNSRLIFRWVAAACLAATFSGGALAQGAGFGLSDNRVQAEVISERSLAAPGDQFQAALKLDIEKGWHVYWRNPGDSGLPPEVEWAAPDGVEIGDFTWPTPHAIPFAELMNYGYEDQLILPFMVRGPSTLAAGDELVITGEASWLVCLDTCIPESQSVTFRLPIGSTPEENDVSAGLIANSLLSAPVELSVAPVVVRTENGFTLGVADPSVASAAAAARQVRFFPDGHDILHAEPQPVRWGEAGVQISLLASDLAPREPGPLSGVLLVEDAEGGRKSWQVQAVPGELPFGIADRALATNGASITLLGFVTLLAAAFAGGLVLNLMPCVLPVLSIKAAGLVHTAHDPRASRLHGLAYLAGVLVCFVAIGAILAGLRFAGEQAGLGFQLQYPPVVGLFALLMFAVGLNMLGVFEIGGSLMGVGQGLADKQGVNGAFFTGVLAAFVGAPCVGPFMAPAVGVALSQPAPVVMLVFLVIGAGLAFPFVLLSFTPALARLMPKPGKWMVTFKQVLAFPMFLTALWLLWVLAGQAGSDGVLLTVLAALLLAFGIWVAKNAGSGWFGRIAAAAVILIGAAIPVVGMAGGGATQVASTSGSVDLLNSEPWSLERVAELQAEGRPVFVDFTARWCVTCQVNKQVAIGSGEVVASMRDNNAVLLIADWTNRDEVIAAELARHGRAGVPLYLVYPASGGEPEVLPQVLSPALVVKALDRAAAKNS